MKKFKNTKKDKIIDVSKIPVEYKEDVPPGTLYLMNEDYVANPEFTHDQLHDALYFIDDAFERSAILFFLVHKTAKQAINNQDLSGDKIEVGVRKLEWISGGKRILDNFISSYLVSETEDRAEYNYNGVPIVVYIYPDDACITQCDRIVYEYDFFNLPNPYSKFEELYG